MQGDTVEIGAPLVATAANSPDLEVKDAQLIFGAVWRQLEGEFGRSKMRFPRELIRSGGRPAQAKVLTPTSSAWCAASTRRQSCYRSCSTRQKPLPSKLVPQWSETGT